MAKRAIYYDTETTGISSEKDRIVEIAAFDPVKDTSYVTLVNPGCPIPPSATAIHHISDDMVKDAPDFSSVGKEFIDFCSGDVVLIAHNNDAFDIHFLTKEYGRLGQELPPWKFLDSLKWARRYRSDLPKHNLQFLRETFGISSNNAHRALDDVKVLYQIFIKMIDDLEIDQVYELMQKKRAIKTMPFGKHQGKLLSDIPKDYIEWLKKSGAFSRPNNNELQESFEQLGLLKKT